MSNNIRRPIISKKKNKKVKKNIKKNKVTHKKVRIKYKNVTLFLLFLVLITFVFNFIFNLKIKNIFIYNNTILTDQKIIELAKIENYPSNLKNPSSVIKSRISKNIYVKEVKVKKIKFNQIHIYIKENRPLFFSSTLNKTVLMSKDTVEDKFFIPTLINYIPDTIYDLFINGMERVDSSILIRISEIKYDPNEVDDKRFLLTMNDGNYVYLTLNKFESINQYIDIIKNFENKKGILYLDSGEYFQVFDN